MSGTHESASDHDLLIRIDQTLTGIKDTLKLGADTMKEHAEQIASIEKKIPLCVTTEICNKKHSAFQNWIIGIMVSIIFVFIGLIVSVKFK
jgi:hypothetical protein